MNQSRSGLSVNAELLPDEESVPQPIHSTTSGSLTASGFCVGEVAASDTSVSTSMLTPGVFTVFNCETEESVELSYEFYDLSESGNSFLGGSKFLSVHLFLKKISNIYEKRSDDFIS